MRQFLIGQRFFNEEFGHYCKEVSTDTGKACYECLLLCVHINVRKGLANVMPVYHSTHFSILVFCASCHSNNLYYVGM